MGKVLAPPGTKLLLVVLLSQTEELNIYPIVLVFFRWIGCY